MAEPIPIPINPKIAPCGNNNAPPNAIPAVVSPIYPADFINELNQFQKL